MAQLFVIFSLIFTILFISSCQAKSPDYLNYGPNDPENIKIHRYCSVNACTSKGIRNHVMCKYQTPGPSSDCHNPVNHPLSKEESEEIVSQHNKLRALLPRELQAPPLKWDRELANIAQRWADQCQDGNDICRSIVISRLAYQNVATKSETVEHAYDLPVCDFSYEFEQWVKEDGNAARPDDITSTFNIIGCGRTVTKDEPLGRYFTCRLVCNYSKRD